MRAAAVQPGYDAAVCRSRRSSGDLLPPPRAAARDRVAAAQVRVLISAQTLARLDNAVRSVARAVIPGRGASSDARGDDSSGARACSGQWSSAGSKTSGHLQLDSTSMAQRPWAADAASTLVLLTGLVDNSLVLAQTNRAPIPDLSGRARAICRRAR